MHIIVTGTVNLESVTRNVHYDKIKSSVTVKMPVYSRSLTVYPNPESDSQKTQDLDPKASTLKLMSKNHFRLQL